MIEERPRGLLSLVAESAVADLGVGHEPVGSQDHVEVVTVVGVSEAAAALAAAPCHCVVLELNLPQDAAFGLLDALEGDAALRGVPVLAHNSHRLGSGREQELRVRAQAQPLEVLPSLDELRERITLHLSAERPGDVPPLVRGDSSRRPALRQADGSLAGRQVLVVDDDPRNVFALSGILELHGMRVLHAENGRAGIEALSRHPEVELILMDVMMPEMDGYAATAAIRSMPQHAQLPIIAVTAKAMQGDREKSLASGANDYVTKPVDANALIACIQRWLRG